MLHCYLWSSAYDQDLSNLVQSPFLPLRFKASTPLHSTQKVSCLETFHDKPPACSNAAQLSGRVDGTWTSFPNTPVLEPVCPHLWGHTALGHPRLRPPQITLENKLHLTSTWGSTLLDD